MRVGGEAHWEKDSVVLQRKHCVCGRRDSLGERQCSVTERALCVCGSRDSPGGRQCSVTERAVCMWEERLTGRKTVQC